MKTGKAVKKLLTRIQKNQLKRNKKDKDACIKLGVICAILGIRVTAHVAKTTDFATGLAMGACYLSGNSEDEVGRRKALRAYQRQFSVKKTSPRKTKKILKRLAKKIK